MATSLYVQAAIVDYLERGYDAHVGQLREELLLRRTLADEAIAAHWPQGVKAVGAPGGFYLWATTPREMRARALLDVAERLGASFLFGEAFFADSRRRSSLPSCAHRGDTRPDRRRHPAHRPSYGVAPRVILRQAQDDVRRWYELHGRTELPWRVVRNPYYTLVSEFMLQQTQVERVIPKFEAFVARFADIAALARASVGDVLREWQGLGYNSRAVRLHETAGVIVGSFRRSDAVANPFVATASRCRAVYSCRDSRLRL